METPENKNKTIEDLKSEATNVSQTKGGGRPGDGYIPLEELATSDPDAFGRLHQALNSGDPASAGWTFEVVNGRWQHDSGYFAYQIKTGFQGREGMGDA